MTSPTIKTEFSATTIIVVLAALQHNAEQAAVAADPESGAGTFVPGRMLRAAGDVLNVPVAYWCRWAMKPAQRSAFAQSLGGPMNILAPGALPDLSRDRWMFEANDGQWTGVQVLEALGMATPYRATY